MYLHTHNFPYIFVQAMSCPIATALLHNVLFIKRKDCQMYIPTHTIPLYFRSSHVLSHIYCIICIMFSSERKKNVKCTYTHTHTTLISQYFRSSKNLGSFLTKTLVFSRGALNNLRQASEAEYYAILQNIRPKPNVILCFAEFQVFGT